MTIEIEIDEVKLKEMVLEKIANTLVDHLMDCDHVSDWTEREAAVKKVKDDILDKIDWKKAAPMLTEVVVKKFFEKNLKS